MAISKDDRVVTNGLLDWPFEPALWKERLRSLRSGPLRSGTLLLAVVASLGARPALAQESEAGGCLLLCAPSLAIEPTFTIENLLRRHRVQDVGSGLVARAERDLVFEMIFALDVPTTIPRVGFTLEAIWSAFAGGSSNPFTGESAEDAGRSEIRDNPVELEFELNLDVLKPEMTGGWIGAHFDVVDQFSPADRPRARGAYTHKLDFELDIGLAPFNRSRYRWLRSVELEASLDYLATGLPRAGEVVPVGGERYLDDASPWSLSFVLVVPVAPLRR
ncbi:MAG: hypothetical protein ACT4P7_21950 [Gemmatimonadaceae bacterium]